MEPFQNENEIMAASVAFTPCPLCDGALLVEHPHDFTAEHQGHPYRVTGLRHATCPSCASYLVSPEQSRHNKRRLIAARARVVAAQGPTQPPVTD